MKFMRLSFVSERGHGIDIGGAACRYVAGHQSNGPQEQNDFGYDKWIGRADLEELAPQQPR
jgi:hypothetical protein